MQRRKFPRESIHYIYIYTCISIKKNIYIYIERERVYFRRTTLKRSYAEELHHAFLPTWLHSWGDVGREIALHMGCFVGLLFELTVVDCDPQIHRRARCGEEVTNPNNHQPRRSKHRCLRFRVPEKNISQLAVGARNFQ